MAADRAHGREWRWLKRAAGVAIVMLAVTAAAAPWPFSLATLAPPAVAHAAVFDWSLRRPDALPAMGAFAVGLLLDVVSGPVFGLGALTCIVAHYSGAAQRRFLGPRGIGHAWIGLALTALAIAPLAWIAASAYVVQAQPIGPTLAQAALTAAIFPPLALAFAGLRAAIGLGGRTV